jgi:hypothetical protein
MACAVSAQGGLLGACLDGVAVLFPARNTFLEHLHVPVAKTVEILIGQTGQMVWAGSIEHHRPVARHIRESLRQLAQRQ